MNINSTSALLLVVMISGLLLTACSTASKNEPAPYEPAPVAPSYEPKPDRN